MAAMGNGFALWIGLGAIAGACCRHYLSGWIAARATSASFPFPYGTFVVNLMGSFAIGLASSAPALRSNPQLSLLIITGFLGAFTTFSTYTLESYNLWSLGQKTSALVYWLGSPILGLLGLGCGFLLGHRVL